MVGRAGGGSARRRHARTRVRGGAGRRLVAWEDFQEGRDEPRGAARRGEARRNANFVVEVGGGGRE